ncbi:MAG: methyltransferase protein [Cytophagaceae bacterium]|jgi:2-polyprenyl-3-methyl-5-hydroxy-6-metoxy-1,4-benzoquinol methylase|nr:methyltransferase protein [Cytophagaceae bacterium]
MHTQESINQLFNNNSDAFGQDTEQQYKAGSYKRGDLFLKVTKKHVSSGGAILDYGCGTGRISLMLGKEGYHVLGVDPAINHIEKAVSLNTFSNVQFNVLTDSSVASASSFDAVVSSSVFEFVPDPLQYISDIHHLLKPGGILIISFPNLFSLWRVYSKIRFGKTYHHFKFQKNTWSQSEIIRNFKENGFRKAGRVHYYESAFDHKGLGFLNTSRLFGTLFVMVFQKESKTS